MEKIGIKITNGKRTWIVGDIVRIKTRCESDKGRYVIAGVTNKGKLVLKAYGRIPEMEFTEKIICMYDDRYLEYDV